MPSSSSAERSSSQSSGDVRHNIQMYRNTASCVRLVHVLLRPVSTAWLRCDERATSTAVSVRGSLGLTEAAHKTSFEWSHYGTTSWSRGRFRTLCQVGGTSVTEFLVDYWYLNFFQHRLRSMSVLLLWWVCHDVCVWVYGRRRRRRRRRFRIDTEVHCVGAHPPFWPFEPARVKPN